MSQYRNLLSNPPKLTVKENAREAIFKTISCMCDNISYLKFKKNNEGDWKMDGMGNAISNWQMAYPKHEIEWKADLNEWNEVIRMINSGTSTIESVISR